MNVLEGLKKFMNDNGYDGIKCDECACELDDFMPCGADLDCNAEFAKKLECKDCKKENECERVDDEGMEIDYCYWTDIKEYRENKK